MNSMDFQIETVTLKEDMNHKGKVVLRYRIDYPRCRSRRFSAAAAGMNELYRKRALLFQRYCRKKLFPLAAEQYEYAIANKFPLMTYEAERKFTLTYLAGCAASLYTDEYVFTGGAHGNTVRRAETWNLKNGKRMALQQFFTRPSYRGTIFRVIERQMEKQLKENPTAYFDNDKTAIREEFDPQQFYLCATGVVVYYQHYDIAPYSSGIPAFVIPFGGGLVRKPRCGPGEH